MCIYICMYLSIPNYSLNEDFWKLWEGSRGLYYGPYQEPCMGSMSFGLASNIDPQGFWQYQIWRCKYGKMNTSVHIDV